MNNNTFQGGNRFLFFLKDIVALPTIHINKLVALGWTQPHTIVNRFGLNNKEVARSFISLEPSLVMPKEYPKPTTRLFMFSHFVTLGSKILRTSQQASSSWDMFKQHPSFDSLFATWEEDGYSIST